MVNTNLFDVFMVWVVWWVRGGGVYLLNPIFEFATEGCVEFGRNVVQNNLSFRTLYPTTAVWLFSKYFIDGLINTRTIDLKKIFIVLWRVLPKTLSYIRLLNLKLSFSLYSEGLRRNKGIFSKYQVVHLIKQTVGV